MLLLLLTADCWYLHAGKPPLYLQHEGHSRTVVGIERCLSPQAEARAGESAAEYSLVILDPGMPAHELLGSLRYGVDVIVRHSWVREETCTKAKQRYVGLCMSHGCRLGCGLIVGLAQHNTMLCRGYS
jgi:hypothetical protein